MSMKSPIASGPNFQLYTELFDDAVVYLELEGAEFEATNRRLKVAIPAAVWEVLRQYAAVDLSWAGQSDAGIRQFVAAKVKDRMGQHAPAEHPAGQVRAILRSKVYGDASDSEAEQVARGYAFFTRLRDQQAQVIQDIADLRRMQ